ncbi:hypothetical protein [Microbacterium sp. UBA837]|uniref:hypothetical protein n=1 Tax=Microbacterium sp. UBA837 TaxID=1946956 RepID=UPI0025E246FF|nr:hypothetical protein [Microbacterium sp. UBA837]
MSKPTTAVRDSTYERDMHRCVSCGVMVALSFQHRRAVGNGGSKIRPTCEDGLTLCVLCNNRAEHVLQARALYFGWKVRRWVKDPSRVPVYYPHEFGWFRLVGTRREKITAGAAHEMMRDVYGDEHETWRAAA